MAVPHKLFLATFSIITEAHLCLPEANRVFALADAIEFFKLSLVDTLEMYVSSLLSCPGPE